MAEEQKLTIQDVERVAQSTIAHIEKQVGSDLTIFGIVVSQLQNHKYMRGMFEYLENAGGTRGSCANNALSVSDEETKPQQV